MIVHDDINLLRGCITALRCARYAHVCLYTFHFLRAVRFAQRRSSLSACGQHRRIPARAGNYGAASGSLHSHVPKRNVSQAQPLATISVAMHCRILFTLTLIAGLAACSFAPPVRKPAPTTPPPASTARGGGYYLDDGPEENPPANLHAVADAVPRHEPLHRFANRQYVALGQSYIPDTALKPYREEGLASWYGRRFHGKRTASGELYDMYAMTAAHRTLPIPSYARVTVIETGKSVVVRINDRGPFHKDRVIDLSYTAAYKLGYIGNGSARVIVESIDPASFNSSGSPLKPGHYVQLGAFGKQANAEKLLGRAREALGLPAELAHVALIDDLHRVNLGPFSNQIEADAWAEKTRAALGIETITIVR